MTSKWDVNDFLDQYESRKTKTSYRTALKQFFTIAFPELKTSKDPQLLDKLSLQYFEMNRDIRKDIIAYKNSIKHQAPKTRQSKLSPIFRYFEDNGIEFTKSFTRNLYGKNSDTITTEHVPSAEEIGRIIQYLPIQAETLTLVLASSGMRIGEALQLTLGDIELDRNPARINLPADITKTKKKRMTFISMEASAQLEEWLSYRIEYIRRANRRGLGIRSELVSRDDMRLFPFTSANYLALWKEALKKADLDKRDSATGRIELRPHNLRKFFRTHGEWTNPDVAEALMGHLAGMSAIYARYDQAEEILEKGYLEAEANLSVFERSGTVIELRERVDKQSEDIQKLVTNLSVENIRMKERVEELEKIYDMSVDDRVSLNLRVEDLELMIEHLVKDLPAVMVAPEADLRVKM